MIQEQGKAAPTILHALHPRQAVDKRDDAVRIIVKDPKAGHTTTRTVIGSRDIDAIMSRIIDGLTTLEDATE